LGIQLTECLKIQPAKDAIEKMSKEKTFEICLTWYGEGSVAQAFEIWHNYSD